ncbi:uncharacterized protein [Hemitrygon akajei]|uniref:uncharacterized protein n=1 Tax=Hemitrygon akajei TaxID=2704970 RepID=UPI003BF945D8
MASAASRAETASIGTTAEIVSTGTTAQATISTAAPTSEPVSTGTAAETAFLRTTGETVSTGTTAQATISTAAPTSEPVSTGTAAETAFLRTTGETVSTGPIAETVSTGSTAETVSTATTLETSTASTATTSKNTSTGTTGEMASKATTTVMASTATTVETSSATSVSKTVSTDTTVEKLLTATPPETSSTAETTSTEATLETTSMVANVTPTLSSTSKRPTVLIVTTTANAVPSTFTSPKTTVMSVTRPITSRITSITSSVTTTEAPSQTPKSRPTTTTITTAPGAGTRVTSITTATTTTITTTKTTTPLLTEKTLTTRTSTILNTRTTTDAFCVPMKFIRINLIRIKSEEISISWDTSLNTEVRYKVILFINEVEKNQLVTNKRKAVFRELTAGVKYRVVVSVETCNQQGTIQQIIITPSRTLNAITRIRNRDFIPAFEDKKSREYEEFIESFIQDLKRRLDPKIRTLLNDGKMRIVINSILPGSVKVDFKIVYTTEEDITLPEVKNSFSQSLETSEEFIIDLANTTITEQDNCQPGLNDCSGNGTCIRLNASYTCQCNAGFMDTSTNTPGRICEDVDECQTGNNTCSDLALCTNTPGNFSCSCFQQIIDTNPANPGTQCTDPNTCFVKMTNICALSSCLMTTVNDCKGKIAFRMKATLRSKQFTNDLKNPGSEEFRTLSANFINTVVPATRMKLDDNSFNITIIGFQSGSVQVNFLAILNSNSTADFSTLQSVVGDAVKQLDENSSVTITGTTITITEAPIQPQTVPTVQSKPQTENPGWRVAVIVLGALLGVAFLIALTVVLVITYRKKVIRKYNIETSNIVHQIGYSNI